MDAQDFRNLQEAYMEVYNELDEGKVEWDNPKKPLQSGLTPREKNRAKRISTNVENPNRVSFGGKSWDISDKDYERYGKLKMAHDDEKSKKVPRSKRHEFGLFKVGSLTSTAPKGELRRKQKDHKNIRQKINSKLYKDDERQKVYHQNDLKEPKESYDYYDIILSHLLDEGYAETPEAAEAIMVNMSEEWRENIMERQYGPDEILPGSGRTPKQKYRAKRGRFVKSKKPSQNETGKQRAQRMAQNYYIGTTEPHNNY